MGGDTLHNHTHLTSVGGKDPGNIGVYKLLNSGTRNLAAPIRLQNRITHMPG